MTVAVSSAALEVGGEWSWEDEEVKIRVRIQKAAVSRSPFSGWEVKNCSITTVLLFICSTG